VARGVSLSFSGKEGPCAEPPSEENPFSRGPFGPLRRKIDTQLPHRWPVEFYYLFLEKRGLVRSPLLRGILSEGLLALFEEK
jgi:hypothetical protein